MVGASADDHLVPEAFRIWGASLGDGGVLRALVSSDAGQTFERVGKGTLLCMTFGDPLNLRSMQVKGRSIGAPEPPGPADLACMERYDKIFCPKSLLNGTPPALWKAFGHARFSRCRSCWRKRTTRRPDRRLVHGSNEGP